MRERFEKYFKGDAIIWMVIVLLSLYSLLAVYSATDTLAFKYQGGNTSYYILKHASLMVFSLVIVFITHHIPYKFYSRISQVFLFISIPLLIITLFMGTSLNEASRWLTLPLIGFTIQTSDFAKLAVIMYVARVLSMKQENISDFRSTFIPLITPILVVCLLILPANFSTAALLLITSLTLLFIGRVKIKYILGLVGIGLVSLSFIFLIYKASPDSVGKALPRIGTWMNRIENFSSGEGDGNYQVEQAKIAVSTGGVIGRGPGKSVQRNFLPHPYSDFIFAIIIEEYGLLFGAIPIILLYLYLLYRAGVIVQKANRTYPAFLTIGLAISIVFQAMINMAVTVNIFPVTGQTLPLVSMGGSSMLFTSTAFGIILSVSRSIMQEEKETAEKKKEEFNENESAEAVEI